MKTRCSTLAHFVCALLLCVGGCAPKPPHHGTAFIVALDTNRQAAIQADPQLLTRTGEVLRRRLRGVDVPCFMEREGEERLIIEVPPLGSDELDMARKAISSPGILEYRMVHPNSAELIGRGIEEPGYEVLKISVWSHGRAEESPYLVNKKPERGLAGKHIKRAVVKRNHITSQPEVAFEFDAEGARLFELLTTEYQPRNDHSHQVAIVLDGKICSAARINGVISGARGVIRGNFSVTEAQALASVLENPVETPHRVIQERTF